MYVREKKGRRRRKVRDRKEREGWELEEREGLEKFLRVPVISCVLLTNLLKTQPKLLPKKLDVSTSIRP